MTTTQSHRVIRCIEGEEFAAIAADKRDVEIIAEEYGVMPATVMLIQNPGLRCSANRRPRPE